MFLADGILLKEVNRLLRIDGFFVYSAPPAYKKDKEYPVIWDKLVNITSAMCWELIARKVQTAIWVKKDNPSCLENNVRQELLNSCDSSDDSKPSWNTPLKNCVELIAKSSKLPPWPQRLSEFTDSVKNLGIVHSFLVV